MVANLTYVAFDGDEDIHYYRLMCAWDQHRHHDFNFYDAHELSQARDSSSEETIKRSLRERLKAASCFVILIGSHTRYLYKFVRWEMEQALKLGLPIIGVNLNGMRWRDTERCPPIIHDELVVYTSFNQQIIKHALNNWPATFRSLKTQGNTGPYYYTENVYSDCGIKS